ncbi:hypothetical protein [Undibacterium sp. Ren11W]|uniref:hypothetical protein n=1 Tax=Undibacterium sp. Ren11W TaxID=3413045 RepID=UPI003BF05958
MSITKEQWTQVETELSGSWGHVEMLIDGFKVNLHVERVKLLKYTIMTYVNGQFCGKWMIADSEEGKRFFCTKSSFVLSAKHRAELIKIWGGKRCPKAKLEELNKKTTILMPHWSNVKTMRRHFEKNNQSLELVSIGFQA